MGGGQPRAFLLPCSRTQNQEGPHPGPGGGALGSGAHGTGVASTQDGQSRQSGLRRSLNIYMCVYRKNQEQELNTKPSPAQRLPSPTPFSKNNQEKKFIKISCRNSLKFTVACRHCTHRPAPQCPIGCVLRAPGPRPTLPETDRQTDRRQEDAAAAPSLNREVKKLNKLKQQINNTDLGQPAASGSSSTEPGQERRPESTCSDEPGGLGAS